MEQKKEICKKLEDLLKSTRAHSDLESLEYTTEEETCDEAVIATYTNGFTRVIDVSADSGISMIRDVLKNIG